MDFVFPYLVQFLREYTGKASIPSTLRYQSLVFELESSV